jgi:hypothetical protein
MPHHSSYLISIIYNTFLKLIIDMTGGVNTQPSADIHHAVGSVGSAEAGCLFEAGQVDAHDKHGPITLSRALRAWQLKGILIAASTASARINSRST